MFRPRLRVSILLATALIASNSPAADLDADQQKVLNSIREKSVLSTVTFLSSDEMAGRQTPSPELRIASRFVASRFRGAGLEFLADNETYFQTHEFEVTQPPTEPITLQIDDGASIRSLGVLCGGPESIQTTGRVYSETQLQEMTTAEYVVIDEMKLPPQSGAQPQKVMLALRRRVQGMTAKGAKVVLMKCEANSPVVEVSRTLSQRAIPSRKGLQPDCAIVLIPSKTEVEGKVLEISAEAQRYESVPVRNVFGVLRGSDSELADEAVFVTAHLDHIGTQSLGDDKVNNGADDNASGVTAIVELADAFSALKHPPKRSIVFGTFWGEEKGMLGSKAFMQKPLWPVDGIAANVNLEMIGRPENDAHGKIWMTGWKHSNLGELMNLGAQRAGVEVFNRRDVGEMLYRRSDNISFVQKGVVAHSFSAGSLHADYHQPSDEWEKLNIPHMVKVIQGLYGGILHVANSDERPKATKAE